MQTEKCDKCGKIAQMCKGSSYACIFDFAAMEPSHDNFRCLDCTEKHGQTLSNAMPSNDDMSPYQRIHSEDIH